MMQESIKAEKDQEQREFIQQRQNRLRLINVSKCNFEQIKAKKQQKNKYKQDQIQGK